MKVKKILDITAAVIYTLAGLIFITLALPFQIVNEALSAAAEAFNKCANKIVDGFNDAK